MKTVQISTKVQLDRVKKAYSVQEVFSWIEDNSTSSGIRKRKVVMDGDMMSFGSLRYETFMQKGTICCKCGLVGDRFYKERNFVTEKSNGPYHFNLYGVDADGDEILITKDHIIAKSLGGTDTIDNLQPLCMVCNGLKANKTIEEWEVFDINTVIIEKTYIKDSINSWK